MSATPKKNQGLRDALAQGSIGLMACVGAHMFLVDPVLKKISAAKAQEMSLASQANAAENLRKITPQITAASQRVGEEAERIRETGRLASHEKELFAAMSTLATRHNIRVDQMSPKKLSPLVKNPAAGATASPADGVAGVAYTIDASATYNDLADFLRAIRSELGYTSIKALRMSPGSETRQKIVHAFIETEHYAFDVVPVEPPAEAGGTK